MGFLLKVLGVSLGVAGINRINHDIEEENRRKSIVCRFDGKISEEEFYVMVKQSGKGIRRITSLHAKGTMVYGVVRSKSGITDWCFKIDFNDYGKLTGKYWILSDNDDSDIPKIVASRIRQQIIDYNKCKEDVKEELDREKVQEGFAEQFNEYCPCCGKLHDNQEMLCIYCGAKISNQCQNKVEHKTKGCVSQKERLQKKQDVQECHNMKLKQKSKCSPLIIVLSILIVFFAMCFILFTYGKSKIKQQEQELQTIVNQIMIDIENKDFSEAYLKANSLYWNDYWTSEGEDKWDATRKEIISQIEEAEKEAVDSLDEKGDSDRGFDAWFNWLKKP